MGRIKARTINNPHLATRNAHDSELVEDYVEEIFRMGDGVRVSELAKHFGVSHVTAIRMTQRLKRNKFLTPGRYSRLILTAKGKRLARAAARRHDIVVEFLLTLGVPRSVAERDAEGIEHHVSTTTLRSFERAIRKYY